jgi:hypothetical protein
MIPGRGTEIPPLGEWAIGSDEKSAASGLYLTDTTTLSPGGSVQHQCPAIYSVIVLKIRRRPVETDGELTANGFANFRTRFQHV